LTLWLTSKEQKHDSQTLIPHLGFLFGELEISQFCLRSRTLNALWLIYSSSFRFVFTRKGISYYNCYRLRKASRAFKFSTSKFSTQVLLKGKHRASIFYIKSFLLTEHTYKISQIFSDKKHSRFEDLLELNFLEWARSMMPSIETSRKNSGLLRWNKTQIKIKIHGLTTFKLTLGTFYIQNYLCIDLLC